MNTDCKCCLIFIALSSQLLYSEFRFTLATLPVASVQVQTTMYLVIGSGFFRIVIVAIIFLGAFLFIGFFSLAIVSLVPSCAVVQVFFCRRLTQRVSSPAPHQPPPQPTTTTTTTTRFFFYLVALWSKMPEPADFKDKYI